MSSEQVVLTIVTVTFNAEAYIAKTIESVLNQAGCSERLTLEYVFVDGKSSDRTTEIIASYQHLLEAKNISVRIICETDKGIYDAMNKGVSCSGGRWILMMNAGDVLYNDKVFCHMENRLLNSDAEVLYGDYCRKNAFLDEVRHMPPIDNLRYGMILCHQSVLVRNKLHERLTYDLSFRLDADYHLLLKAYLSGAKFEYLPICIVSYDLRGLSAKQMLRAYSEEFTIRRTLGASGNSTSEKLKYFIGYSKRFILTLLPEKLRWKIYHILKKND